MRNSRRHHHLGILHSLFTLHSSLSTILSSQYPTSSIRCHFSTNFINNLGHASIQFQCRQGLLLPRRGPCLPFVSFVGERQSYSRWRRGRHGIQNRPHFRSRSRSRLSRSQRPLLLACSTASKPEDPFLPRRFRISTTTTSMTTTTGNCSWTDFNASAARRPTRTIPRTSPPPARGDARATAGGTVWSSSSWLRKKENVTSLVGCAPTSFSSPMTK